jgi:polysaccharide pyruvyl transferase WcaK-like protein
MTERICAFQISNGAGSGNIGDEMMARAFWDQMPSDVELEVGLLPESVRQRQPYPSRHRYWPVDWQGNESASAGNMPGILVGDTPVTDAEGLQWPFQFLGPRLRYFHQLGQPVDAVGVGVDCGLQPEGRLLFNEHFLPIRSWTVRSHLCRDALISLGVSESKIRVGADWAWLYRRQRDRSEMARALWRKLGVDPERPLIVVNVVNMQWRGQMDLKCSLAAALDSVCERSGLQVGFFCNECRPGDFFDHAAALQVAALMRKPAFILPNEYFSPDEAIALLSCATVTLGQRYHFVVESVLAGCVPIGILRGEKMRDLVSELPILTAGTIEHLDRETVIQTIQQALEQRVNILTRLDIARAALTKRALDNLSFLRTLPPYADARW